MPFHPNPGMERALAATPEMKRYLDQIADEAAEEVRRRVPVDSGTLRDSIEATVERTPEGYVAKVTVGNRKAFYWGMVEFGTSRLGARPYFRPGIQALLSRFGGRFKGDST
jgi:HK97 gp10 family phage protein